MTQAQTAPLLDPDQAGFVAPGTPEDAPIAAPVQVDYFGFGKQEKWFLPDGVSYMAVNALNEGMKKQFQKRTQKDVTLERNSGNAKFAMDPGEERHELIIASVVDWNLIRGGAIWPLSRNPLAKVPDKQGLRDWLEVADPKIVEDLEQFIHRLNPWLRGDMKVEDIDEQIRQLQDLREEVLKADQEKGSSSNK